MYEIVKSVNFCYGHRLLNYVGPCANLHGHNAKADIMLASEDLDERGLLETTMVLALGEFGRTPKINPGGGRDHWSNAMSVLMAGGGTPGGLALGATDKAGYSAVERVLSPENFVSTINTKMGIDPDKVLYTPEGRPSHLVSDPTPIPELFV